MKRILSWTGKNSDTLVALALAILVSSLDATGIASGTVITSATVVTLGVIAFVLLHDRGTSERTQAAVHRLELKIDEMEPARVLEGDEIPLAIKLAYEKTKKWAFRGSTATFVRNVILPACAANTKLSSGRVGFEAQLEILDPTSPDTCEEYVRLYQKLAESPSSPEKHWTVKGTQIELYATILSACWHMQHFYGLDISIALTKRVSTFRLEASSDYFMLTQRGPQYPAIIIARQHRRYGVLREHPLYGLFVSELKTSFEQSRHLPLERARFIYLSETPTIHEACELFAKLEISPIDFDDDDISEIIAKSREHHNPYAHS